MNKKKSNFLSKKKLMCALLFVPFSTFLVASDEIISSSPKEIQSGDSSTNTRGANQILWKPLIVEFYNGAGYSGWFQISWTDTKTGETVTHTSNNKAAGQYQTYEVPKGTDPNTIVVKGFSNTGILWDKYRKAFDINLGYKELYDYRSRLYYAVLLRGTTFAPYGKEYKPKMGIDNMDPYSDYPINCTDVTTYGSSYSSLTAVAKQYDLRNLCQYTVKFTFDLNSGDEQSVDVTKNSTDYFFTTPNNKVVSYTVQRVK